MLRREELLKSWEGIGPVSWLMERFEVLEAWEESDGVRDDDASKGAVGEA